jgi:hypothetical protein
LFLQYWGGILVVFAAVALCSASASAQDGAEWSDWKATPNFPGIKVRVICHDVPGTGDSEWGFQFVNTYQKWVQVHFQEESGDSTGLPPKFSVPSEQDLSSGQQSPIYTDYVKRSCDARKKLYIRVRSVKDDQGNQTQPKAGSGSMAMGVPRPGRSVSSSVASSDSTELKTLGSQAKSQEETPPSRKRDQGQADTSGISSSTVLGVWDCVYPDDPNPEHNFSLWADGVAYGFLEKTTWYLDGNSLKWSESNGRLQFNGTFTDSETLEGTVSNDSTLDILPYHKSSDTVHCKREAK